MTGCAPQTKQQNFGTQTAYDIVFVLAFKMRKKQHKYNPNSYKVTKVYNYMCMECNKYVQFLRN